MRCAIARRSAKPYSIHRWSEGGQRSRCRRAQIELRLGRHRYAFRHFARGDAALAGWLACADQLAWKFYPEVLRNMRRQGGV